MEKNLFSDQNLLACWQKVLRKKSRGGLDNTSVRQYKANIQDNITALAKKLQEQTYIPDPGKRVFLAKSKGEKRAISMVTVEDKIVQMAVKQYVEPRFEQKFADVSYAYRPNKGHRKAIRRVRHNLQGHPWVATCDIDRFFDEINHNLLMEKVARDIPETYLLELIQMWLKIGSFLGDRYVETAKGVPQGGIISPLLSNIYLHDFDREMLKHSGRYVRYADDFIMLAKNQNEAATLHQKASAYLQNDLQLNLNKSDKTVFHLRDGFVFLGIRFLPDKQEIAPAKVRKALGKIDRIFSRGPRTSISHFVSALNESVRSWKFYYGECENRTGFIKIQEKIYKRFSAHFRRLNKAGLPADEASALRQLTRMFTLINLTPAEKRALHGEILKGFRNPTFPWDKAAKKTADSGSLEKEREVAKAAALPDKGESLKKVKSRVRKYERRFADDYDLVLSDYGVFLGKRSRQFMVRKRNRKEKRFAASRIKHILVLSPSVKISSAAVYLAAEENIPIDFIDYSGKPFARMAAPDNPAWRYGRQQLEAQKNGKGVAVALAIVEGKIRNQLNLLKYYGKYHRREDADFKKIFDKETALLETYLAELKQMEESRELTTLRGTLFGLEGRAAGAYWNVVRHTLSEPSVFKKRVRRHATDAFNVSLNYGYGVLYSRIWGALMRNGLNVQISFLHAPQYQKPTLVFDMIEEFRAPVVDRTIVSTFNRREEIRVNSRGRLTEKSRKVLLENLFERLNTPVRYAGRRRPLQEIILLQAGRLAKFLNDEKPSYQPFVAKW